MFSNYLKTAIRNLLRSKVFSLINIAGLALGLCCSLLIYLWIKDELGMDSFHTMGDRLCQVMVSDKDKTGALTNTYSNTPGLLADALKKEVPEISRATTLISQNGLLLGTDKKVSEENGYYAGSDFFSMFSFRLLRGNPNTALSLPDNIVISSKLAFKYFGNQDPMGKIIRVGDKRDYKVSGVAENPPENSSLQFDFVLPIQDGFEDNNWMIAGWNHFGPATYVLLQPNTAIRTVNAKLKDFLYRQDSHIDDKSLSLQLFRTTYLYNQYTNGVPDSGRISEVRLFSLVAVFILLIACINFMNLDTARSVKRAREVGVRKVMGAQKGVLFWQFLIEAILTVVASVLLALVLAKLVLPAFNQITGKQLILNLKDPGMMLMLGILTLVTGSIAGSYPALFLSSLQPIAVLKGVLKFKYKDTLFRKALVVFQFTISIILIVCTVVVIRQMKYIQSFNLGLDHSNLIYVSVDGNLIPNYDNFKREALNQGSIESIAFCATDPIQVRWYDPSMQWDGRSPDDKTLFAQVEVGYDFLKTMKIPLVAGRDFSPAYPQDSSNYIINEAAARYMKMKNPIGASFSNYSNKKGRIIGLVRDYHVSSLHAPIVPLYMNLALAPEGGTAVIRTYPGKTKQALALLGALTKKLNPKYPFDFLFVNDELTQEYHSEMILEKLADASALIAILISCMGLFGLSMFTVEQRTKEIAIRKVIGASVSEIVALVSRDFLVLVVLAFLIANPIALLAMTKWLHGFAYKIGMEWWIFGLAGLLALGIAAVTISFQSLRSAKANPVRSLRAE